MGIVKGTKKWVIILDVLNETIRLRYIKNQIGTSLGAVSGGAVDAIVATTDTKLGTIDFPIIDAVVRDSTGSPKREV